MSEKVFIYAIGMTQFGKFLDRSTKDLVGDGLNELKSDSDVDPATVEAAWFSNSGWGYRSNQHCIRGQVALSANGIEEIPMINVENACGGGSTAIHGAWTAIKAGLYDCVLAIGVEKVYHEDRKLVMQSFAFGTDYEKTIGLIETLKKIAEKKKKRMARQLGEEVKKEKKGGHSAFMDLYAAAARSHMKRYGTTQRQLAIIASKAHNNSVLNPKAQYRFPMTPEQVLEDYPVAYPLTRSMCAPIGDGAAAAILVSEKFLKENPTKRAILIRASALQSGSWKKDTISSRTAAIAYKMAGIGPQDINVAEVHDATAFGELHQIEEMGFCPLGQGGPFSETGATALDGRIAVNPSGGLISRGHPIGASGIAQLYELVTQLRGEAGERQVKNPRFALAENGGGNIGPGEAAMGIHILEKNNL